MYHILITHAPANSRYVVSSYIVPYCIVLYCIIKQLPGTSDVQLCAKCDAVINFRLLCRNTVNPRQTTGYLELTESVHATRYARNRTRGRQWWGYCWPSVRRCVNREQVLDHVTYLSRVIIQ